MSDSVEHQEWPNVYAQGHGVERQRRGQKVARGKREARRPWISNNNDFRPNGPTETGGCVSAAPSGLSRFLGMIQGLRARCASPLPLATFWPRLRRSRCVHDETQNS